MVIITTIAPSAVTAAEDNSYVVNIDIVGAPVDFNGSSLAAALVNSVSSLQLNTSLNNFVSTDADITLSKIETCSQGYYCPGSVEPQPCPAGTFNDQYGQTSITACKNCSDFPQYAGLYCGVGTVLPGNCNDGFYLQNGQCIICPAGSFCNGQSPTQPQLCTSGTYLNRTGATMQSDCLTCTVGNYCVQGSTIPAPCPAGKFISSTGAQSEASCNLCQPGYYCLQGSSNMIACAAGTFNKNYEGQNISACKPCPPSYISTAASSTCIVNTNTAPGYYFVSGNNAAQICPVGTFNPNTGATICQPCGTGLYCAAGSTEDGIPCANGYFLNDLKLCSECPAGMYCASDGVISATPTACMAGTYNKNKGGVSQASCTACPAGSYCPANATSGISSFTLCSAGFYNPSLNQTSCTTPCPAGSYCPDGSSQGTPCAAGSYSNKTGGKSQQDCTQCVTGQICKEGSTAFIVANQCPLGSYCPPDSNQPISCPQGKYGTSTGFTSVEQCTSCTTGLFCAGGATLPTPCNTGYYVVGTACTACPAGSYCLQEEPYQPILCPAGSYRGSTGGSSCYACLAGGYCLPGAQKTTFCSVGFYSTAVSATSSDICQRCTAGYYCTSTSSTSATTKTICPVGNYCPEGSSVPTACELGYYLNTTGATSADSCTICPAGFYCGNFAGTSTPTPAPAGTYISQQGSIAPCTVGDPSCAVGGSCISGQNFCPSGATGPISVVDCPKGYYCPSDSPQPIACPLYTYKNFTGSPQGSVMDCTTCPEGTYCGASTAYTTPGLCLAGTYVQVLTPGEQVCTACPPGFYCTGQGKFACPAGTINNDYGSSSLSKCSGCPAGGYCPSGSATKTLCPAGTFFAGQNATSVSACVSCTVGKYCPAGSSGGTPCWEGTFSASVGNSHPLNCSACPTGNYCPAGSITPTQCPAGTFRSMVAAHEVKDCQLCTAGYYCLAGTTNPIKCKDNTISIAGQTSALGCRCMPGYYCTYTEHITATISVQGSMADFVNNTNGVKDRFIAAIAQAAGNIPIANVQITAISPLISGGNRRLLSTHAAVESSNDDSKEYFTVQTVIRNAKQLRDLHRHLQMHVGNTLRAKEWSIVQGGTSKPKLQAADAAGNVLKSVFVDL